MKYNFNIIKASKTTAPSVIGIYGNSGSGKTYSSLQLALGMASNIDNIFLIDTENGRGGMYYDSIGDYNTIPVKPPFTPDMFISAINFCLDNKAEVIIIDSFTHEWAGDGGILESVDSFRTKGGKASQMLAWKTFKPPHNKLINKISTCPVDIILNMRAKNDTKINKDGSVEIKGIKHNQDANLLYECLTTIEVQQDHTARFIKLPKKLEKIFKNGELLDKKTGEKFKKFSNKKNNNDDSENLYKTILSMGKTNGYDFAKGYIDDLSKVEKALLTKDQWKELSIKIKEYHKEIQEGIDEKERNAHSEINLD